MKIRVILEMDETDDRGLQIIEDLKVAAELNEAVRVRTPGTSFTARVVSPEEVR